MTMLQRIILLLFFTIYFTMVTAQTPSDSTLVAAYNYALNDNWEHLKQYFNKEKKAVYSDFLTAEYLSIPNQKHFKVLEEKNLGKYCNRIFVTQKPKQICYIKHKNFQGAQDTLDILIIEQSIRCLKHGHLQISTECRGGMGYIPDGRLIYQPTENLWTFTSFKTLYDEALAREDALFKKRNRNR